MLTSLRKIGNSRGIALSSPLLTALGIRDGDAIALKLENDALTLRPVTPPRIGWFDSIGTVKDEDVWEGCIETEVEQADWEW